MYKITAIDPDTSTVLVTFKVGDCQLDHTTNVDNVEDKDGIIEAVDADYKLFIAEIANAPVQEKELPKAVTTLIGKAFDPNDDEAKEQE